MPSINHVQISRDRLRGGGGKERKTLENIVSNAAAGSD